MTHMFSIFVKNITSISKNIRITCSRDKYDTYLELVLIGQRYENNWKWSIILFSLEMHCDSHVFILYKLQWRFVTSNKLTLNPNCGDFGGNSIEQSVARYQKWSSSSRNGTNSYEIDRDILWVTHMLRISDKFKI